MKEEEIKATIKGVLKMIPITPDGDGYKKYNNIPLNERDNNSWWYLDGELVSLVGYDGAAVTNCKSGGFGIETINPLEIEDDQVEKIDEENPTHYMIRLDGIVEVEVEGIDKPCIGFFWTTDHQTIYYDDKPYEWWRQRGLVCLKSDTEAIKCAQRKYRDKDYIL